MSERVGHRPGDGRLLTFEVGAAVYALPVSGVLEVTEVDAEGCIPTLTPRIGGVVNYHGNALPLIRRSALFDVEEDQLPRPQRVLVVSDRATGSARLGVPVDRVLGLVDGPGAVARGSDPIAERRPIGGRVANVLDPEQLVARAREVIEQSLAR